MLYLSVSFSVRTVVAFSTSSVTQTQYTPNRKKRKYRCAKCFIQVAYTTETMSLLENEVAKLEKKGYKGSRKSLKYGKAVILKKKKSGISGFAGYNNVVYLYSAYKEPDAQAISEFLYSFKKFVSDEGLDINDVRGNFLVKGAFDKATFNTLRKEMIKKDSMRNAITVKQLEKV